MAKKPTAVLDIPIEFGGVSIGKTTARLGAKFSRDQLTLELADQVFCGHRLTGRVMVGGFDDSPGQKTLVEPDHELAGTFDCKQLGVTPSALSTGLTFGLADIDVAELAKFSNGSGRIIVTTVAEIPDDASDDAPEDDEQRELDLKADGPWKEVPVDSVFSVGDCKKLKKAGINTIGALAAWSQNGKELTDIDGIGPAAAERIEETMVKFWEQNPEASKEEDEPETAAK